jgi:hypothetical protein
MHPSQAQGSNMRKFRTAVVIAGLVSGGTTSSAQSHDGQTSPLVPARTIAIADDAIYPPHLPAPDSARRQAELELWVTDFSAWKTWADQWQNRPEPGWFTQSRKRRPRPDPPDWLFYECKTTFEDTGPVAEACTLLAEWDADYGRAQVASVRVAATTRGETSGKVTWWEHVHLDMAWPSLQSGVGFGVIGMHATTNVGGRLEVFIAPGAMLLNVPTHDGKRAWKVATNYGIGYRLGQFRFPGNRQALLHLNLAKAWLLSGGPEVATQTTDFIGFSITFKKTR